MINMLIELHPRNHDCKVPKDLAAAITFQGSSALRHKSPALLTLLDHRSHLIPEGADASEFRGV